VWVLVALLVGVATSGAIAQPESWAWVSCAAPAFSISAPAGWTVQPVSERGAKLVGPAGALVVEVVAWDALRPPASAAEAVREHEGLLVRAMDYSRRSEEPVQTVDGDDAVIVTGLARANGIAQASVFCAYGNEGKHWVVGAFCAEEMLAGLRAELFDVMMRSFRPGVRELVAPPVEPPVEPPPVEPPPVEPPPVEPPVVEPPVVPPVEPPVTPVVDPGPMEPVPGEVATGVPPADDRPPGELTVTGHTEPLLPTTEPGEATWGQVRDETGFAVSLPGDWRMSVEEGRIVAAWEHDAEAPRLVVWWPLAGAAEASAEEVSRLLALVPQTGGELTGLVRTVGENGAAAWRGWTASGMDLLASYATEDGDGLLVAAMAPAETMAEHLPELSRIAASMQPGQWRVGAEEGVDFLGDNGLVKWRAPQGWQSRGGARSENDRVSIEIEAMLEGSGRMRLAWRQPIRPAFRNLTALLASLGWREGETYADNNSATGMMVYRRRDPRGMVEDYLLGQHPQALTDLSVRPFDAEAGIAGLLAGDDASGQAIVVHGDSRDGERERLYLVATARAEPPLLSTCWEAAELRVDAPAGSLAEGIEALRALVASAAPAEGAPATITAALNDMIGRAERALRAIPDELTERPAATETVSVLEQQAGEGGREWKIPAGALGAWE